MRIRIKGRKIVTEHIWFERFHSKNEVKSDAARVHIHANPYKIAEVSKLQYSLITDLGYMESDFILNKFSPTVRNEIRRAQRDGVACKMFTSSDLQLNEGILKMFSEMYHEMYREKNLDRSLEINSVKAYVSNGVFLLSCALIGEKPCVFHSYVFDKTHARLLHSCSEFRVEDNTMKNAIGRANKLLHYADMRYLKDHGTNIYDWGGIADPVQPNGIDQFKMSFGGIPVSYYNCTLNLSFMAKLASLYQRIFRKTGKEQ